jgi:hypothetical protein
MFGSGGSGRPAFGFGFRAEIESVGLDVSFLNQLLPSSGGIYDSSDGVAVSLLRLEALRFLHPRAKASAYFGGGLSLGNVSASESTSGNGSASTPYTYTSWRGAGLQGELTTGYELPRDSDVRIFVQADATLPFYPTVGEMLVYAGTRTSTIALGHRYNPSLTLSLGIGWKRQRP